MIEWGASGVGQSSWGPAVYGLAANREAGMKLAERVRDLLERLGPGTVYDGPFRSEGARVWRGKGRTVPVVRDSSPSTPPVSS
jgi:predicted sugar kinase